MQHIDLSEMTNRLHRNTVAAATVIIGIRLFHLQIDKAGAMGLEIKNLTTGVLVMILFAVLVYHAIAYGLRAYEEYRLWELKLTDKEGTGWDDEGITTLAKKLIGVADTLDRIIANSGAINAAGQRVFTADDAAKLVDVSEAALIYAKRFDNFPRITRWRFWLWDIGLTAVLTLIAAYCAWPQMNWY